MADSRCLSWCADFLYRKLKERKQELTKSAIRLSEPKRRVSQTQPAQARTRIHTHTHTRTHARTHTLWKQQTGRLVVSTWKSGNLFSLQTHYSNSSEVCVRECMCSLRNSVSRLSTVLHSFQSQPGHYLFFYYFDAGYFHFYGLSPNILSAVTHGHQLHHPACV